MPVSNRTMKVNLCRNPPQSHLAGKGIFCVTLVQFNALCNAHRYQSDSVDDTYVFRISFNGVYPTSKAIGFNSQQTLRQPEQTWSKEHIQTSRDASLGPMLQEIHTDWLWPHNLSTLYFHESSFGATRSLVLCRGRLKVFPVLFVRQKH